jgi:hypothetical protein
MPSDENLTVKINIGPHVSITERSEKLVCTRCDYLKHNLIRSGRDPQWECLCLHPRAKEVAQAMPGADRCWSTDGTERCWIGEQPDTPEWCPLLKRNLEQPSASDRRANAPHERQRENEHGTH